MSYAPKIRPITTDERTAILARVKSFKDEVMILRGVAEQIGARTPIRLEMVSHLKYSAMRCGELLYELELLLKEKESGKSAE